MNLRHGNEYVRHSEKRAHKLLNNQGLLLQVTQ